MRCGTSIRDLPIRTDTSFEGSPQFRMAFGGIHTQYPARDVHAYVTA
jgi:hypothetical protein